MTHKSTKRALLMSVLSVMLCLAMLVGSTFAWFTDSVTSGMNRIVAGNLDVELYHTNGYVKTEEKVDVNTMLFLNKDGKDFKWEPGAMVYETFKVVNEGTLALQYTLRLTNKASTVNGKSLTDVLKVATVDGTFDGTREAASKLSFDKKISDFEKRGALNANENAVYSVVIYWEPTENDNAYNVKDGAFYIDLGVLLSANQATVEKDAFDEEYDRLPALVGQGYAAVESLDELKAALSSEDPKVVLKNDIKTDGKLDAKAGAVIDGNGNKIIGVASGSNEGQGLWLANNVEYRNIVFENESGWGVVAKSAKFYNCTFNEVSPYIVPAADGDIVVDGCTIVNKTLQICYNEGGNKNPAEYKTTITNNKFIVNNASNTSHAMVLAGGSPEFWANGAETVTITGNTFTPNYPETTYIAYYIYGASSTTLTSVPVYSNNTFNGDANYSMNGVAAENQYPLSRVSGFLGNEEIPGLTWISDGFYQDATGNFYASTAAGLRAMNNELNTHRDFNKIGGKSYNLLCDINMNGQEWKCVDLTTGSTANSGIIFNGNGHAIRNMNIIGKGMFSMSASGSASDGNTTIKNLTLDNVTVTDNGNGYHVGAIWGQMYGNVVLDNVHVVNSTITGKCNVGAFIGRNGDQGHSTIKFINCSVSNTTVTATGSADPIGASAFLGATLKVSVPASVTLTFEGENTSTNVTLNSAEDQIGGGIYAKSSVDDNGWHVEAVDAFDNFDNRD